MPYQTYIKGLLHEALVREAKLAVAGASRPANKRGFIAEPAARMAASIRCIKSAARDRCNWL
jgi:hypothetical protein